MTFFRTRKNIFHNYQIYNQTLRRVNQVDDLGFKLVPSLSFNNHIEYITFKALRTLDFIRRNTSDFDQAHCLVAIYTLLVRSILEYWSVVWSPYTQKNIERIESVQKRFFSFTGYVLKINHPPHDYTPVSKILNLASLDIRRKVLDIRFINNLVNGKIDATRILNKIAFRVPRIESRTMHTFQLNNRSTNYLCNDLIQKTMRLINLEPNLLDFKP